MTDKEHAVMDELWRTVNALRWQHSRRLATIAQYRAWLPECKDRETRRYYNKWLDFLEQETLSDQADDQRRERVRQMAIERPMLKIHDTY